jgi:hypothetical protein
MTVYLNADCALSALIGAQFINPEDWKRENSEKYNATFYHGKTRGTICFEVSVEGNVHRISTLYMSASFARISL